MTLCTECISLNNWAEMQLQFTNQIKSDSGKLLLVLLPATCNLEIFCQELKKWIIRTIHTLSSKCKFGSIEPKIILIYVRNPDGQ